MILKSLALFLIISQGGSEAPKAEDAKAEEAKAGEEVAEEEDAFDPFQYAYIPVGKRDPFVKFVGTSVERGVSENPLLNYEIGSFRLTGVVWGLANPRAILTDPAGQGHIVRRGTRIGKNRGRVMRLLKDRLVVAEQFRDPLGKKIVREVSLTLNEGASEGARK